MKNEWLYLQTPMTHCYRFGGKLSRSPGTLSLFLFPTLLFLSSFPNLCLLFSSYGPYSFSSLSHHPMTWLLGMLCCPPQRGHMSFLMPGSHLTTNILTRGADRTTFALDVLFSIFVLLWTLLAVFPYLFWLSSRSRFGNLGLHMFPPSYLIIFSWQFNF